MKIEVIDDNKTVLYINKDILKNLDLDSPSCLESYFKKLIINLKKYYNLKVSGDYNVKAYINDIYGIIIELVKLDDYTSFKDDIIDMRIMFNLDSEVLFEVDDYFYINDLAQDIERYYYNDKYYCRINNIDDKELIKLSDFSKIIYGENTEDILNVGLKID